MLDNQIEEQIQRLHRLQGQIRLVKNYQNSRDLLKLARSCENWMTEISREQVTCRRIKHTSTKLSELLASLTESVNTLEEYLFLALLVEG